MSDEAQSSNPSAPVVDGLREAGKSAVADIYPLPMPTNISPLGGRAGSHSGGSAPPAEPRYRPPTMTPKQAFRAAALARSGGSVQSLGYDSGLERIGASAAPHAQSTVSKPLFSPGPAGAIVGGIRALVTLLDMGVLRLDEPQGAIDLGDVSDVSGASTPLGDAAPFEYVKSVAADDVMSIAARGVSEAREAQCFAEYETDMDLCSAGGAMFKSPAYFLECKSRAFANYQQCRGY